MEVTELLATLRGRDIRIEAAGGKLRVDAPAGALTADIVDVIRQHKAQLLERLRDPEPVLAAGRTADPGSFPLSLSQHAFFMLEQLDPGNRAYNIHSVRRVRGAIDVRVLAAAIDDVARRHDVLRTTFELRDGAGTQLVHREMPQTLSVTDLSTLAPVEQVRVAEAIAGGARRAGFPLDRGPLLRIELVRTAAREHLFVLSLHHIIADAVSLDIFYRELLDAYQSRRAGRAPTWPPLCTTYAEYAVRQQERLRRSELDDQIHYWRTELAAIPCLLERVCDRAADTVSDAAAVSRRVIPGDLGSRVRQFSQTHGVTPYTTLLAAFQYLLGRYARSSDVPVIVPFSARTELETEPLIGLFVNGLVIRTNVDAPTTEALLEAVRTKTARALSHRDLSVECLESLFRSRGGAAPSLTRLSRIGFNYLQVGAASLPPSDDLVVEPIEVDRTHTVFEVMMTVTDGADGMRLAFEYKTDLLERAVADVFLDDFLRLLKAMVAEPSRPLASLAFQDPVVCLQRLGLDREQYTGARPVLQRTQDLARLVPGGGNERRVLGYAIDLRDTVATADVRAILTSLAAEHPTLRAHLQPSRSPCPDAAYECLRCSAADEWPEYDVGDEDASADRLIVTEAVAIRSAYGRTPMRQLLCRHPGGRRQLVVLFNEALFGPLVVAAHRGALLDHLRPAPHRLNGGALRAALEAELEPSPTPAALPSSGAADIAPLTWPSDRAHGAASVTSTRATLSIDDARFQALCAYQAAAQVTSVIYWSALAASLIDLHAQPGGSFYFWTRTLDFRAASRSQGLGLAVYSPPGRDDCPVADLFRSVTFTRPADAERLPANDVTFVFEHRQVEERSALFLVPTDGALHLVLEADDAAVTLSAADGRGLVDPRRFLERLAAMSDQICRGATRLGDVRLVLADEAEQLAGLNATVRSYGDDTIVTLIERQVDRTPSATAVVSGSRSVTYRELHRASDEVAALLAARGVSGVVGVCVARSERLPAVLLGVLKSGCAYLPLDVAFPPERNARALHKASAACVLAERDTVTGLPAGAAVLLLDDVWRSRQPGTRRPGRRPPVPGDLAYVMSTSGSSGEPKCVAIRHASLSNFAHSMMESPGIEARDVLCAVTTVAFDISILELLVPLCTGAAVVVASEEEARVPDRLIALLERHDVTILQATPSTWQLLDESGWAGRPALKALCGGEPLARPLASRIGSKVGSLWNLYGPTETTIWSTLSRLCPDGVGTVSIGSPIANTRVYVLDRYLRQTPPGIAGELYVAGAGLSPGYHGDPDQTAQRFRDIAGVGGHPERAYRTGDRVRIGRTGELEFLGRIDRQVKIRGHRVELQEIEACLLEHPTVTNVAVTVQANPSGPMIVAYCVGTAIDPAPIRSYVSTRLPAYMVPQHVLAIGALPLTPNGKVDYQALPPPVAATPCADDRRQSDVERRLLDIWSDALGRRPAIHENFFEAGGHSLMLVRMHSRIHAEIDPAVRVIDLFTHPTIAALAEHLGRSRTAPARLAEEVPVSRSSDFVAVIGMAARLPGASDVHQFWRNLAAGTDAIGMLTDEELQAAGVPFDLLAHPRYVKAASTIDDVELFDADFFRLSPQAAAIMDPQIRLLIECSYHALEDAGYNPLATPVRTGVFSGIGFNSYLVNHILPNRALVDSSSPLEVLYLSDRDYASSQVSYRLNLTGPSVTVATACSTSLAAIHLACRSLVEGECGMALAGGVKIQVPQRVGYVHAEGGIFSRDGRCRVFDEEASGTVFGNGGGVVVLKRLSDAVRDGDAIYAVVRGSAMNNDGGSKLGYTAPSVSGQASVIAEAFRAGRVDPDTVEYVEAHGTGTRLGDPVEITALEQTFRGSTTRRGFCAIGSVKSNIGHLDAAAGIAGFIKAVLALDRRQIPPTIHFRRPNPHIAFSNTPFYVNGELRDWSSAPPRRAAVSSFGIGGTNVHAVLEEAPAAAVRTADDRPHLLVCSARSASALSASMLQIAAHLETTGNDPLADAAFTLHAGRPGLAVRAAVVATRAGGAAAALRQANADRRIAEIGDRPPRLVFAYPGQGSDWLGVGRDLYEHNVEFRDAFDRCAALCVQHAGWDLRQFVFDAATTDERRRETRYVQPALFSLEYALTRAVEHWGLKPDAVIGHSLGEYVAACVAGVFSLDDALRLVLYRADLMTSVPVGGMAVAFASAEVVAPALRGDCGLAAINAEAIVVISGSPDSVAGTREALRRVQVRTQGLASSRAFHSALMAPIVRLLSDYVARHMTCAPPAIPLISNVTGGWMDDAIAPEAGYWGRHARGTVLFDQGLRQLLSGPRTTLLEVGPGRTLTQLAAARTDRPGQAAVACLPDRSATVHDLLVAAGHLWMRGHDLDPAAVHEGRIRRRIHLPTYPFERRRCWIDKPANPDAARPAVRAAIDGWFYEPSWTSASLPAAPPDGDLRGATLIVGEAAPDMDRAIEEALDGSGRETVRVIRRGSRLAADGRRVFELPAGDDPSAYGALIARLPGRLAINEILHFPDGGDGEGPLRQRGPFYELLYLAQAMRGRNHRGPVRLAVVTCGGQSVIGSEPSAAPSALALGPILVAPLEHSGVRSGLIDLDPAATGGAVRATASRLVDELDADLPVRLVAFRGGRRWTRTYQPLRLPAVPSLPSGVYLVTGGFGGIGYEIATAIAAVQGASVAIVGRTPMSDGSRRAIELEEKMARLREHAARAAYFPADVSDQEALARAFEAAEGQFGPIRFVVHAAGVADGRIAQWLTREQAERVFAPKVPAAETMLRLCAQRRVEAVFFFSSISAITGDIGQTAYCAANAYLDAEAERARARGLPVYSINWDTWSDVGMARAARVSGAARADHERRLALGIRTAEGLAAFARIVSSRPGQVVISTTPLTQSKPARRGLTERRPHEDTRRSDRPAGVPPMAEPAATETEMRLLDLWRQSFGLSDLGVTDDFFVLGGTSLQAVDLVAQIERVWQKTLDPNMLLQHTTIRALATIVDAPGGDTRVADLIVRLQGNLDRKPPLVLIHPVGGHLYHYRPLLACLPGDLTVYGIASPPPERLAALETVEAIAAEYIGALHRTAPHGPYLLAGSSFGGTVAFEMAQQLDRAGAGVAGLALIDTPCADDVPVRLQSDAEILAYLSAELPADAGLSLDRLQGMPIEELPAYVAARLNEYADGAPALDAGSLRVLLDTFRLNMRAMTRYRPAPFAGVCHFFKARERRSRYDAETPECAWRGVVPQLVVVDVPGNHVTMHAPPHVAVLARALTAALSPVAVGRC